MTIELHFTEAGWERATDAWTAWWAHELDRPRVMVEVLQAEAKGVN